MPSSMSVKKQIRLLAAHNIFVLVTQNVTVVRNELFVFMAESLSNWQLMKKPQRGEPALAFIMNRRPDKICRVLVHSGIGKFMMVPKF